MEVENHGLHPLFVKDRTCFPPFHPQCPFRTSRFRSECRFGDDLHRTEPDRIVGIQAALQDLLPQGLAWDRCRGAFGRVFSRDRRGRPRPPQSESKDLRQILRFVIDLSIFYIREDNREFGTYEHTLFIV